MRLALLFWTICRKAGLLWKCMEKTRCLNNAGLSGVGSIDKFCQCFRLFMYQVSTVRNNSYCKNLCAKI